MWKCLKIILVSALIIGLSMSRFPTQAWDMSSANVTITLYVTPLVAPTVTNDGGASNIGSTTARLNGEVTSTGNENPTAIVYYGLTDGGTDPGAWDDNVTLGVKALGTFYYDTSGLTETTLYYYRMYAENSGGADWSDTSANFTTIEQCEAPTGLTLTDLGYITVAANWTKGAGTTYTMLRGLRSGYPASITDGELLYYGEATSLNSTGYALDISSYYVSAWGFLADNVTYSTACATATIGGEAMTEVADALTGISGNLLLFHGILLFLPVIIFSVLAFWKENPILFMFTAPVSLVTAFESPNMMSGVYTTSPLGITVGLILFVYALFCLGMALKLMFWRGEEE